VRQQWGDLCYAMKLTRLFVLSATELVHDCSINKIPFPALESFEDRIMFPKRYFLFFDLFVRAGRHNRDFWKKAIRENSGKNNMRFGPAIFEAHVRTTVRENYFKWVFQQLTDIHEVEDGDVEEFQMEYDENVYNALPRTLVCTHSAITRFPYKNCDIHYGKVGTATPSKNTGDEGEGEDEESYCSANNGDQPLSTTPNPADDDSSGDTGENQFFLVYKNVDNKRFNEIREKQRRDLKDTIDKSRDLHKDILGTLKDTIKKIREVKKALPETDPMHKVAIAEAKKNLRLFKDPYEDDSEGPSRKKRRRSIENQTRFSDSKVTFFSKANEEMKREEQGGLRKSWESMYKETWNKHLLAPKGPVINVPIPQVDSIIRDMENDVYQLLADCAGMVEEI